jgi:hypothetical protein
VSRACNTNRDKRNSYRILVGKPEGKRPLGRPRRRWVDNIAIGLLGWGSARRKAATYLQNETNSKCTQTSMP